MTEEKNKKAFEPINTQEEFDERIKGRLARERERWTKESGTEDLQAQLAAKDEEIAGIKQSHQQDRAHRAVVEHLASIGVADEGRQQRILKYVDLDEVDPDRRDTVFNALGEVQQDMPELLVERVAGTGSGGSSKPVLTPEKPITQDELENMGPDEINSRWDQVKGFLAGER